MAFSLTVALTLVVALVASAQEHHQSPSPTTHSCTPIGFLFVLQPFSYVTTADPVELVAITTMIRECHGAPHQVHWNISSAGVSAYGSSLRLPPGSLSADTYNGEVVLTVGSELLDVKPFAITVVESTPTVSIQGGDRTVSSQMPIAFVAVLSGAVHASWSLCIYNDVNGNCVAPPVANTTIHERSTPFSSIAFIPLGLVALNDARTTYQVTVTVEDNGLTANDSVLVTVLPGPSNPIVILTSAPSTVLPFFPLTLVATSSEQALTRFEWLASDGTQRTGPIATFIPRTAGLFSVTVTGHATDGTITGNASISFTVTGAPTIRCDVEAINATAPIVGGASDLTITLSAWDGPTEAPFRYGFSWPLNGGSFTPLSPTFGAYHSFNLTSPLVTTDSLVSFAVEARIDPSMIINVTCAVNVTAPANVSGVIESRLRALSLSVSALDIGEALRGSIDIITAGTQQQAPPLLRTGPSPSAAQQVIHSLADLSAAVTTTMTATQKETLIDIVSAAVLHSADAVANVSDIVGILRAVLDSADGGVIDVAARASQLAALINGIDAEQLPVGDAAAKMELARTLAMGLAAQLGIGQSTNVSANGLDIAAMNLPVTQLAMGNPLTVAGAGWIRFSIQAIASAMNMTVDEAQLVNAAVSVSAIAHSVNPVPNAVVSGGARLTGAILEFDVVSSGANFSITLDAAITIGVQAESGATCVYFDAAANAWTTNGVLTVGHDSASGTLLCNTSHLSMFSATSSSSGAGTSAAVIVILALFAVACAAAAALFLYRRAKSVARRDSSEYAAVTEKI